MARDRINKAEQERIKAAIRKAESHTSGEIRVHLELHCPVPVVLDRAAAVFAALNMHKTAARNGVLVYVALEDHKFAIIGDGGINARVEEGFWNKSSEIMTRHFQSGDIVSGIEAGIVQAGHCLSEYFPVAEDDVNELSDEISFGE